MLDRRFNGIARLYGRKALDQLLKSHVLVIGVGGVGSWTAEAIARSGVGRITLVDIDEICVSNINRQLHALDSTIGLTKVDVLAQRIRDINPHCIVSPIPQFFTAATAMDILGLHDPSQDPLSAPAAKTLRKTASSPDYVVDAIDHPLNKALLVATCVRHQIPVIVCGAAGGRCDPTAIQVVDVARATHDRLLSDVRKRLRRDHDFPPAGKRFGVDCIYSTESPVQPEPDTCPSAPLTPPQFGTARRLNCDTGFGSATHVTGAFGFAAAAHVIRQLTQVL